MRSVLFLGQTEDDMASWLARDDAIVLVAERTGDGLCGFTEVDRAVLYLKQLTPSDRP